MILDRIYLNLKIIFVGAVFLTFQLPLSLSAQSIVPESGATQSRSAATHQPVSCEQQQSLGCIKSDEQMDKIIKFKINGILFHVPISYLSYLPNSNDIGKVVEHTDRESEGLSIQFWMPNLYPEDMKPLSYVKLDNQGRLNKNGAFPVKVTESRFISLNDKYLLNPEEIFKRHNSIGNGFSQTKNEIYGINQIYLNNKNIEGEYFIDLETHIRQ